MRFNHRIIKIAQTREGKALLSAIGSGLTLHRIHPSRFSSSQFNGTNRGNAGSHQFGSPMD